MTGKNDPTPSDLPQRADEETGMPDWIVGEGDDRVAPGHKYDGIREYDNPMPGWWVWLFVATIVFSPLYVLGLHQFDFIDTYEENLVESMSELEEIRERYASTGPTFKTDATALQEYADDPEMAAAGEEDYIADCAACHGNEGQGLIGPNLTDEFWIHGASPSDVFRIINEGVPAQGMPPWQDVLSDEQRARVMAYVISLRGTDPPNPKEPQGEPVP